MAGLDFEIFECDSHLYQAKDAFNRHLDPAAPKPAMNGAVSNEPIHLQSFVALARSTKFDKTANLIIILPGPEGLGLLGEHRVDQDLPSSQAR